MADQATFADEAMQYASQLYSGALRMTRNRSGNPKQGVRFRHARTVFTVVQRAVRTTPRPSRKASPRASGVRSDQVRGIGRASCRERG